MARVFSAGERSVPYPCGVIIISLRTADRYVAEDGDGFWKSMGFKRHRAEREVPVMSKTAILRAIKCRCHGRDYKLVSCLSCSPDRA